MAVKKLTPMEYAILKRKGKTKGKVFVVTARPTIKAKPAPAAAARVQVTPAAWSKIKSKPAPAAAARVQVKPAAWSKIQTKPAPAAAARMQFTPPALETVKAAAQSMNTEVNKMVTSFDTSKINQSINQAAAADISAELDQVEAPGMDKKKILMIGAAAAAAVGAFLYFRRKK
jgi:hypothetical protein